MCHIQTTLRNIRVKFGPVATGPTFERATAANGGVGGEAAHANTAYLVRKVNPFMTGRRSGRFFMPGVSDSVATPDGAIAEANLDSFQTALDAFYDGWVANIGDLKIFPASGSDPNPVTSLAIDARAATQRRRFRR